MSPRVERRAMLFSRGARYARMSSSSCGGAPCVEVVVRGVWRRALAGQPAPPPPVVLGLAVVAAVLVLAPVAWPRTRHVVTLAAGYLGPGLFGLGAAFLLGAGHAVDVLWLVLVLLVLLLVQIRNWFGFCSVLVTGTVLLAASLWLPDRGQAVLAYLVTWFLLMAAPRPVLELAAQRRRRGARGTPDSDADQLARLTGVPAAVWIALFLSVTVGALLLGGHRLTLG